MDPQQHIQQLLSVIQALHSGGKTTEALEYLDKLIALKPADLELHYYKGNLLLETKKYETALESFTRIVALNPNLAPVYNNMAYVLNALDRPTEALANANKALALNAQYDKAYNNRGLALQGLGRDEEALANYTHAAMLNPNLAEAYSNKAHLLRKMGRTEESVANYERAISLNSDRSYILSDMLHGQMQLADWRNVDETILKLAQNIEADKPTSPPFQLLALPLSPMHQRKCAENYVYHTFPPNLPKLWSGERYNHKRIRVAYVSADFRQHPASFLLAGMFEYHDKTRFETYGISLMPLDGTATGQRVKDAFEHFIDVSAKTDAEVAQLVREQEIDIAVDLMGFTTHCRSHIFVHRPAPAQINYIGYPATMGTPYMDYIIADAFTIPPENQQYYAEKVVYLPDCYQANDDKRFHAERGASRAKFGLPDDGFVFCSFNNTYKITPTIFDVWMRLLKAVPGSVIWLIGHETIQRNLRNEAEKRGVEGSRLIFAPKADYEEHLTRLAHADIFLDTPSFNAGATASDALWMGVPIVTCAGEAFAARMAGSLLTALGVPELITYNVADYETLALTLATQPKRLAEIKTKIKQNRTTSPLFNTARFTKNIEAAYTKICQKIQAGLLPDHIDAPAVLSAPGRANMHSQRH